MVSVRRQERHGRISVLTVSSCCSDRPISAGCPVRPQGLRPGVAEVQYANQPLLAGGGSTTSWPDSRLERNAPATVRTSDSSGSLAARMNGRRRGSALWSDEASAGRALVTVILAVDRVCVEGLDEVPTCPQVTGSPVTVGPSGRIAFRTTGIPRPAFCHCSGLVVIDAAGGACGRITPESHAADLGKALRPLLAVLEAGSSPRTSFQECL